MSIIIDCSPSFGAHFWRRRCKNGGPLLRHMLHHRIAVLDHSGHESRPFGLKLRPLLIGALCRRTGAFRERDRRRCSQARRERCSDESRFVGHFPLRISSTAPVATMADMVRASRDYWQFGGTLRAVTRSQLRDCIRRGGKIGPPAAAWRFGPQHRASQPFPVTGIAWATNV